MLVIKMKKTRLGSALVPFNNELGIDLDVQKRSIYSIGIESPKMIVYGMEAPPEHDGLRFQKAAPTYSVKNAIGTYMQEFRGYESVMITNPDVEITTGIANAMKQVDEQRMELTWGYYGEIGGMPKVFVISSQALAHVMGDAPDKLDFTQDWQSWVNDWCVKYLRHRYFDATKHGFAVKMENAKPKESLVGSAVSSISDAFGGQKEQESNKSVAPEAKKGMKALKFWK